MQYFHKNIYLEKIPFEEIENDEESDGKSSINNKRKNEVEKTYSIKRTKYDSDKSIDTKASTKKPKINQKDLNSKLSEQNDQPAIVDSKSLQVNSNRSTLDKIPNSELDKLKQQALLPISISLPANNDLRQSARNKSYYPKIPYTLPQEIIPNLKNHSEVVCNLIEDICDIETEGLDEFFKSNNDKNRQALNTILREVLEILPREIVNAIPPKVLFQPEISITEKNLTEKLQMKLEKLEKYNSQLIEYEKDIPLIGQDFDIWTENVPMKQLPTSVDTEVLQCIMYTDVIFC